MAKPKQKTGMTVEEYAKFFACSSGRVAWWIKEGADPTSSHTMYDFLVSTGLKPGMDFEPDDQWWAASKHAKPVTDADEIRDLCRRTRLAEQSAYEQWETVKQLEATGEVADTTSINLMRGYRDILKMRLELEKAAGELIANHTDYVPRAVISRCIGLVVTLIAKELQGFPKMMAPKVNEDFPGEAKDELKAGCLQIMKSIQPIAKTYLGRELKFQFEE